MRSRSGAQAEQITRSRLGFGCVRRLEKTISSGAGGMPRLLFVMAWRGFAADCSRPMEASAELSLSRSRFYVLYAGYLRACAERRQRLWRAGQSGGNHHPGWPLEVITLFRKLLKARPASSYSFAASAVHRRCQLKLDRASVRRSRLGRGTCSRHQIQTTTQSGPSLAGATGRPALAIRHFAASLVCRALRTVPLTRAAR